MKTHLISALALGLLLAGCGGDSQSEQSTATPAPSDAAKVKSQPAAPVDPATLGKRRFAACGVCHTVKEGDASRVGPNLFGVYERPAGSAEGFAYSDAMKNSGVVWTEETLDAFLENPQSSVAGNRMAFAGERKAETRAALIAYLKTLQ